MGRRGFLIRIGQGDLMSLRGDLEKLSAKYWQNEQVQIRPITTESDLIYAGYECQLKEEQKSLVNPFWFSIGRAYLFREDHYPCIIYNSFHDPVGFINLSKWLGCGDAYSWSYYIDQNHQGKGYGKLAAQLAIQILKAANPDKKIKLAAEAKNIKAQALYMSLGFERLAEMDGDDLVFGL